MPPVAPAAQKWNLVRIVTRFARVAELLRSFFGFEVRSECSVPAPARFLHHSLLERPDYFPAFRLINPGTIPAALSALALALPALLRLLVLSESRWPAITLATLGGNGYSGLVHAFNEDGVSQLLTRCCEFSSSMHRFRLRLIFLLLNLWLLPNRILPD